MWTKAIEPVLPQPRKGRRDAWFTYMTTQCQTWLAPDACISKGGEEEKKERQRESVREGMRRLHSKGHEARQCGPHSFPAARFFSPLPSFTLQFCLFLLSSKQTLPPFAEGTKKKLFKKNKTGMVNLKSNRQGKASVSSAEAARQK